MLIIGKVAGHPACWKGDGVQSVPVSNGTVLSRLLNISKAAQGGYAVVEEFTSQAEMFDHLGYPRNDGPMDTADIDEASLAVALARDEVFVQAVADAVNRPSHDELAAAAFEGAQRAERE